jgi:hypothetical protein
MRPKPLKLAKKAQKSGFKARQERLNLIEDK